MVDLLGTGFIIAGLPSVASALVVYPSTFLFYLIPQSAIDRLSDAALAYLAMTSVSLFWAIVLFAAWVAILNIRTRSRHEIPAP